MKRWRWLALAGCGAALSVACGSSFSASEQDPEDGSTGPGDASTSDESKQGKDADVPDAAQDGGDGKDAGAAPDACGAGVSSPVCVAVMNYIAACNGGEVTSCECTYLKNGCETFAGELSEAFKSAYAACATTE